jgi:hypothetical protein
LVCVCDRKPPDAAGWNALTAARGEMLPFTVFAASMVASIVQRVPIGTDWLRPYCAKVRLPFSPAACWFNVLDSFAPLHGVRSKPACAVCATKSRPEAISYPPIRRMPGVMR